MSCAAVAVEYCSDAADGRSPASQWQVCNLDASSELGGNVCTAGLVAATVTPTVAASAAAIMCCFSTTGLSPISCWSPLLPTLLWPSSSLPSVALADSPLLLPSLLPFNRQNAGSPLPLPATVKQSTICTSSSSSSSSSTLVKSIRSSIRSSPDSPIRSSKRSSPENLLPPSTPASALPPRTGGARSVAELCFELSSSCRFATTASIALPSSPSLLTQSWPRLSWTWLRLRSLRPLQLSL
mmetsp:Transcript_33296/g.88002  ORF Transcript_33296/g.88002 Transcript_33296/m.88002 type:complete len:240 (+) Transcript_33296:572-1291(+)